MGSSTVNDSENHILLHESKGLKKIDETLLSILDITDKYYIVIFSLNVVKRPENRPVNTIVYHSLFFYRNTEVPVYGSSRVFRNGYNMIEPFRNKLLHEKRIKDNRFNLLFKGINSLEHVFKVNGKRMMNG